jgi:hypothetical protein
MALNKATATDSDVINIFEAEGAKDVFMGIKKDKFSLILNHLIDAYTKPKEASVREVVSNATDATVLLPVSERRPIEITSPSTFKPSFTVRDYGVGMSPETVEHIYLQFGGTTKEFDFSQIGSKGLGAKAPLAYCSEFSVSTTRDGITTDILISRNSEGPGAKILGSRETDEPNGTVVTIPVRMEDRADFLAALECYRKYSFDTQISIDGAISSNTEDFINFDKIVLDEESNTEGRVWVNKASLTRLFKNAFVKPGYGSYRDSITTRYSLSGWIYSDPDSVDNGYYGRNVSNNYDVIIELKPGIVDFSTSRDEITKNDRSKALSEVSATAITKNPEYIFKNIMKEYATLTDKEAYSFASELIELIDPVKTDLKTVHLGRDTVTMSFEVSEFTTATGFNPFELILNRHEKNVVAIVSYGTGNYSILQDGLPNAREELLKTRPELKMFYRSESWSAAGDRRVGTINSHIVELVEDGARNESLVDYIAESVRGRGGYVKPVFSVVTGIDEKSIKKINARRKVLSDKIFNNKIVFFTNLDSISQDQVDLAETITSEEIEFITADELIEKANDIRKEIAKSNPNPRAADELISLTKVETENATTKAEVVKALGGRGSTSAQITLEDLIAADAILLIGDQRNHRNTLIGAANSGMKITGRDIYTMGYGANFRAAHYEKLKNYEGAIVSKDWTYNSVAFTAIAATRSYSEVALNEEIEGMSHEKVVSMYLLSKSRNCGNPFLKFLETSTTEDADNEIFSLVAKAAKLEEYPAFSPDFLLKVLTKNLGEEKARKVRAFIDASSMFRSGNYTDLTVLALMRFQGSILPGESMAISARDVFIERYRTTLAQILADEAAALKAAAEVVDSVDLTVAAV